MRGRRQSYLEMVGEIIYSIICYLLLTKEIHYFLKEAVNFVWNLIKFWGLNILKMFTI